MDADRALVEAVLANRAGAFEHLVRDYQGLCWHIIQRMVRHPEDTRELCQEAFLRVHRYLHQYRFDSPLKSWIGQVAYSVAKRHLERKRIALADMHVGGGMDEDDGPSLLDNIGDGVDLQDAHAQADDERELHVGPILLRRKPRELSDYAAFRLRVARKALDGARQGGEAAVISELEREIAIWEEAEMWL